MREGRGESRALFVCVLKGAEQMNEAGGVERNPTANNKARNAGLVCHGRSARIGWGERSEAQHLHLSPVFQASSIGAAQSFGSHPCRMYPWIELYGQSAARATWPCLTGLMWM